jgi:hypothetical protein
LNGNEAIAVTKAALAGEPTPRFDIPSTVAAVTGYLVAGFLRATVILKNGWHVGFLVLKIDDDWFVGGVVISRAYRDVRVYDGIVRLLRVIALRNLGTIGLMEMPEDVGTQVFKIEYSLA